MNERVRQPAPADPERTAAPSVVDAGHQLLGLQGTAGNATVTRLIQTKLTVGRADDPYEREADRVASEVMRRLRDGGGAGGEEVAPAATPAVQLKAVDPLGGTAVPADLEQRISASSGRALDGVTRSSMEGAFGADFSGVKVHTGPEAATLSESLQAHAFTTGSDIFFGKGADPSSSPELLAHELTHVVQQSGGAQRSIRRFVSVSTFQERTDEGWFTGKSTAQKEIEKYLTSYAALGVKDPKGKITIPDTKLKQAMDLILSMKTAAESWIGAHTLDEGGTTKVDPNRVKRAAGMSWFMMAADGELAALENRLNGDAAGTAQDAVVPDEAGRLKLKEHYQGNLSGSLTKMGQLIDKVVPNDGDSTELSIDLKIPVQPGVFVGGTLTAEAEKDDGKVEAGIEAAFQAGGEVGVASIAGALGGYFKAGAKTGVDLMRLVSYGFYRKFRESEVVPSEVSSLIWGGGTSDWAKKKADLWSLAVENDLLAEGSESFVELGGLASVKGEANVGVAELEGEAKYTSGKRYDAESLKNRKGGAGKDNKRSDSFFTQNVADKFGRGAEKSTGRSTNNLDLSFAASLFGGAFTGELGASFSWRDKGLTALERAKPGAVTSELEEASFSLALGGNMPSESVAAGLVKLAAEAAAYGKKQSANATKTASAKEGVPLSELALAKSYAQVVYDMASGAPLVEWYETAAEGAAEEGAESALEFGGSVGLELEIGVEKGDSGWEGSIELKYVKGRSIELPEILEIELVRKSRLGKTTFPVGGSA